jgi:hypothetical protein
MSLSLSGVQRGKTVLSTEGRRAAFLAISSALRSPASLHTSVHPYYTFKSGWFRDGPTTVFTRSTFLQVLKEKKGSGIKSYVCTRQRCGSGMFIPGPGSEFFPPGSWDKKIPDLGFVSASKNLSILTQKIVSKLSEI